jgi:hypothetical protein
VMPEICHSFVSRYVVIASAARNERERPVLLASFSSLLLVERSTRTEMYQCSYVHIVSHAPKCAMKRAQLCDRPTTAGRSMRVLHSPARWP